MKAARRSLHIPGGIVAAIPGLVALLAGLGVPPDSRLLFGGCAEAAAGLLWFVVLLLRDRTKKGNYTIVVMLAALLFLTSLFFLDQYQATLNLCIVSSRKPVLEEYGPVFFPIHITGKVQEYVEKYKGRQASIEELGPEFLDDQLNQMDGIGEARAYTTRVLLAYYLAMVGAWTLAFSILAVSLQARPTVSDKDENGDNQDDKTLSKSQGGTSMEPRDIAFFSYAHEDRGKLDTLLLLLKPAVPADQLWDDAKIPVGAKWKDEIERALGRAKIAILLVTPPFLGSEFIKNNELPRLLDAAEKQGAKIIWILWSECFWEKTFLKDYQAPHDVDKPLDTLSVPDRNRVLKAICLSIVAALGLSPQR